MKKYFFTGMVGLSVLSFGIIMLSKKLNLLDDEVKLYDEFDTTK